MRRRDFLCVVGATGLAGWIPGLVPPARRRGGSETRPYGSLSGTNRFVERWSWAMGQAVHLQLFAGSEDEGYAAAAAALAELRRVEAHLSRFDDRSDLCELNRTAGRKPIRVGRDLSAVLAMSTAYQQASGGAFNVGVEPLMRTWGFRELRKAPPGVREIQEAREAVANATLLLSDDKAHLPHSHTQLDLGGIGVGYGLDRAAAVLRGRGISRAFIDVSGDCLAIGAPPGEAGWRVDLADPAHPGEVVGSTTLRDQALATSANTVSVVHFGSVVRGHVMNPRTGWPAEGLRQVSVLARTATAADALSTAMLVAGTPLPGVERFWKD